MLLSENCEVRLVIRFLVTEGHNAAEIHRWLQAVYEKNVMLMQTIHEWVHRFATLLPSVARKRMTERTSKFLDDSNKGSSILNYTYNA